MRRNFCMENNEITSPDPRLFLRPFLCRLWLLHFVTSKQTKVVGEGRGKGCQSDSRREQKLSLGYSAILLRCRFFRPSPRRRLQKCWLLLLLHTKFPLVLQLVHAKSKFIIFCGSFVVVVVVTSLLAELDLKWSKTCYAKKKAQQQRTPQRSLVCIFCTIFFFVLLLKFLQLIVVAVVVISYIFIFLFIFHLNYCIFYFGFFFALLVCVCVFVCLTANSLR